MTTRLIGSDNEPEPEPDDKLTFVDFVNRVNPRYRWSWFTLALAAVLQRVADGELTRVQIRMPPRHGKSELASRLFPAYYLYCYPERWVGMASYGANLAYPLSKAARQNFVLAGGMLDPSARAVKEWQTTAGGGLWASGVGGAMTGKGWNLGIIDDPIKDDKAAMSDLIREGQKEWYRSTFYNRQMNPDALVVIQTRWHEDDLSGWLLSEEFTEAEAGDEGEPEFWHIVHFPAIRQDEDDAPDFPSTCTVEPDPREPGEALWPERFPLKRLRRIMKTAADWWEPMYQQNPQAPGGSIFQEKWFGIVDISNIPKMIRSVVAVDLAVSERDGSAYTVAIRVALGVNGMYYIFRPYRKRAEAPEALRGIEDYAALWRPRQLGVEAVAYQLAAVQLLRKSKRLTGIPVVAVQADKDKLARARGWSPFAEQGLVYLVSDGTGWETVFLDEHTKFPKGKYKDQVDATGIAFELIRALSGQGFSPAVGGNRDDPFNPK